MALLEYQSREIMMYYMQTPYVLYATGLYLLFPYYFLFFFCSFTGFVFKSVQTQNIARSLDLGSRENRQTVVVIR